MITPPAPPPDGIWLKVSWRQPLPPPATINISALPPLLTVSVPLLVNVWYL
jgi:hypothetical protein